jgi:hypothetical protein
MRFTLSDAQSIAKRSLVPASAATTAAAVTAATTTAAAATTTAAIFARAGFVDGERSAIMLFAVHAGDRRLGFLVVLHFDKAEAFAPAGVAVHDDLGTLYCAVFAENLVEV